MSDNGRAMTAKEAAAALRQASVDVSPQNPDGDEPPAPAQTSTLGVMAVTPLTLKELESMDRSAGATWPRGVYLVCQCGKVGTATSVEGHRGRSGNLICRKKPDALRTLEEAEDRSAEVYAAREEAERNRVQVAIDQVEADRARHGPEPSEADDPTPKPGRGGKPVARGDGRQPSAQRSDQLGPATVRISVEMEAKAFARYDQVRRDPQFGFVGDPGDYLNRCEEALWQVIDWLAAGQQGPISIRLAA